MIPSFCEMNRAFNRSNMSQQEKRDEQRHDLELPVKVRWKDTSGTTREATGTTKNISPSGAFIVCDTPINADAAIDLHINLPVALGGVIKSNISANARVVRDVAGREPDLAYGHGVKFNHFSFERL